MSEHTGRLRGPIGELWVTRLDHDSLHYRIDHADPRILITGHLAEMILGRGLERGDLVGQRWKVHGVDRTVVYVLTSYDPQKDVYEAEWPD